MEHLRDEFDAGGFVGVLLFEVHDEAEGAVFKGRVGRTDDDGVPVANHKRFSDFVRGFFFFQKMVEPPGCCRGGEWVPGHHVVGYGRGGDTGGWVGLHSLGKYVSPCMAKQWSCESHGEWMTDPEVSHETTSCCCGHVAFLLESTRMRMFGRP